MNAAAAHNHRKVTSSQQAVHLPLNVFIPCKILCDAILHLFHTSAAGNNCALVIQKIIRLINIRIHKHLNHRQHRILLAGFEYIFRSIILFFKQTITLMRNACLLTVCTKFNSHAFR